MKKKIKKKIEEEEGEEVFAVDLLYSTHNQVFRFLIYGFYSWCTENV